MIVWILAYARMGEGICSGSRTFALNDSYTLLEEARKVPQAAAF